MPFNLRDLPARLRQASKGFSTDPSDLRAASAQLDAMIRSGELPTIDKEIQPVEKAAPLDKFKRNVTSLEQDQTYAIAYNGLRIWTRALMERQSSNKEPPLDDPLRDEFTSLYWMKEPILAGAVYSMTARAQTARWTITGRRNLAIASAKMLSRAQSMGPTLDWGTFSGASAQDFYTTNRGVFWELAKEGDPLYGRTVDIGHMDALCCYLTGNSKRPVFYTSEITGQSLYFQPGQYTHFTSMPSPREGRLGMGFCAVDRAYRAAKMLLMLHDYDEEKLSNLPPEGIAAISGLTMEEFLDAVRLWQTQRKQDNSLTFPQVLWLVASEPNARVEVDIKSFSSIPEAFDRKTVIDQYAMTIALVFGVDVGEFWTITGGGALGGSAGASEINNEKAKGKGNGEYLSASERHINGELPVGVEMRYDSQDTRESAAEAAIAKAWIDAFMPLYNLPKKSGSPGPEGGNGAPKQEPQGALPNVAQKAQGNPRPNKPDGTPNPLPYRSNINTGGPMTANQGPQQAQAEQVIDKKDLMRLLADKGVLPDWMLDDQRTVINDNEVHEYKSYASDEDFTSITWDRGVLKESRLPPIVINSPAPTAPATEPIEAETLPSMRHIKAALDYLKEREQEVLEDKRNIRGEPIPEAESIRGAKVTMSTLKAELERWRTDPILSAYALTPEEEKALLGNV